MLDDYIKAKHLGDGQYRKDVTGGRYPYLTALDDIISQSVITAENRMGVMEIPISAIAGTKTRGRQESFATNFMPILSPKTEFAMKWGILYDAAVDQGIRDAILVYEYMNRFYVQEGNKRVSVSKYNGAVSIVADVIRLMPERNGTKENNIYYEFVEFFKAAGFYGIRFSEEGQYQKLCDVLGLPMSRPWDSDTRKSVKSAFDRFSDIFDRKGGNRLEVTRGDAFLLYLKVYGLYNIQDVSNTAIESNLDQIWREFLKNPDDVSLVKDPDVLENKERKNLFNIFAAQDKGFRGDTLKIAFIYEKSAETSSWAYGHEFGRHYLDDKFGDRINTFRFENCETPELVSEAIDAAADTGADVIFTTTGMMIDASVKAQIKHPDIYILNCSVNTNYNTIRTYYGRMYEAKFLMGALAASVTDGHDIGYAELCPQYGTLANVNAFAIGAQMVNPYARIHLKWTALKGRDWKRELRDENIMTISGPELTPPKKISREFGVYMVADGDVVSNIAMPIFDWGKYYEIIINSILGGTWGNSMLTRDNKALNFWFGMKSGVIDVILSRQLGYASRKMLRILKKGIMDDGINPFDGELYSQTGLIKGEDSPALTGEEIVNMHWLNDNVIGTVPSMEAFDERAQELMRMSGFMVNKGEQADEGTSDSR
ncbi:BMP family ABC transporter substrate-binding protein [Oribacterium sp. WCC10]|uniref:BMP family ABC transporter substrate-binding protein n=1 Tax=Oribacterium sp. WCC10 TaxID=1855343 RepID=UPI000B85E59B|nr:BMP family ABC transporter substrate-binding protein [Oribacterium sp. WCC10]